MKKWKIDHGLAVCCAMVLISLLGACNTSKTGSRYASPSSPDANASAPALSETKPVIPDLPEPSLGRGINMGNYLEAAGNEGAWNGGRLIEQEDFIRIRSRGLTSVRIPVRWSDHALKEAPYTIDPLFMARVKQVVQWAFAAQLKVVLNVHHYEEMMNQSKLELPKHRQRLSSIWSQICDAFPLESYPADSLVFELLNEPNGAVGYDDWNGIIAELTELIWREKAQDKRKLMIGTANWGGVSGLYKLRLPESCTSENTIITVHFYEPFQFTHQGAEWVQGSDRWIGTRWLGSPQEKKGLQTLLDGVQAWNRGQGRNFEIFLGEFGSYGKYAKPQDRKAWTSFIVSEAEKRGMSWAYWEYSQGFGAYNPESGQWRDEILQALLPDS